MTQSGREAAENSEELPHHIKKATAPYKKKRPAPERVRGSWKSGGFANRLTFALYHHHGTRNRSYNTLKAYDSRLSSGMFMNYSLWKFVQMFCLFCTSFARCIINAL